MRSHQLVAFVNALAKFLVGNQADKSIQLEMGNKLAKEWAELRSTTPLFGYPTVEEATRILSEWLDISPPPPEARVGPRRTCGRLSFVQSGHYCVLPFGHKGGHDFQTQKPDPPKCAWPSGCKNKPLKNLSFCRKHQPFPARKH